MAPYQEQILACDFFTMDTFWLQTIYVLSFIELGSRSVHFADVTTNPDQIWVTQQARHFDAVFESEGLHIINIRVRAPNANA
jgi:putative transposase